MKANVITFPGSNCDKDIGSILANEFQADVHYVWHKESFDNRPDLVVLPGGFSFGDYLRCGAMAKYSPCMKSVDEHRKRGGFVLGICNGFQILTEAGYLPGALLHNRSLKYVCKDVDLLPDKQNQVTAGLSSQALSIPIAHGEGAYFADEETLKRLEGDSLVAFRYAENPNGSLHDIAGITDAKGKILGMMPHPERAMNPYTGKMDGKAIFESIFKNL
ncbi:phosphoribosylformylglycinamidine synthase glutamine amidotransferase subunit [Leptospira ryugenii]|uniref:Phosphoribosylformylglycinamidine synthase subunit PurQ n=1 Tax=Leptospira ryugenii TaxID=1917863 RepID=A0A2P2DWA7_9LEPT|nr:phosphoribosylformylglycinamidine synthase subunit PurQ [Leptospira ryugenii]GBF48924.1 phosphoribosylformylglycinamidine synthase glutamine amidotransferase subunit [Leptospira ryugenii]